MREFSEKEREQERHYGQVAAQRILNSALRDREEAFRERDTAFRERDQAVCRLDAVTRERDAAISERDALAEIEKLKERLKEAGIPYD